MCAGSRPSGVSGAGRPPPGPPDTQGCVCAGSGGVLPTSGQGRFGFNERSGLCAVWATLHQVLNEHHREVSEPLPSLRYGPCASLSTGRLMPRMYSMHIEIRTSSLPQSWGWLL